MSKLEKSDVQVSSYVFAQFEESSGPTAVSSYEFHDFRDGAKSENPAQEKVIKIEREIAQQKQFQIAPVVEEFRGMSAQAQREREEQIAEEVEKRVALLKEGAFEEGLASGKEQGRAEMIEQMSVEVEGKLAYFTEMIHEVLALKTLIVEQNKKEVFTMVRNLSRWIILRELSEDGKYIERLLEKLIVEIGSKEHLLIHVNEAHFKTMPDVLEMIQKKLGALTNVRVEIDYSMESPGIVLEGQNGIINASLEKQFESLNKLFESVGITGVQEAGDE